MGQICGKEKKKFTPKKEVPERTNEKEGAPDVPVERITSLVNENVGEEVKGALKKTEKEVETDETNAVSSSSPEQLKDKDKENDVNDEETDPLKPDTEDSSANTEEHPKTPRNSAVASSVT